MVNNRLIIISTKPIKQRIWISVDRVGHCCLITTFVRGARFVTFIQFKALCFTGSTKLAWVTSLTSLSYLVNTINWQLRQLRFGWSVELNLRGNAYIWRRRRIRKMRQSFLTVRAGFFYNLLVCLPKTVRLFWRKSYIRLFGTHFGDLVAVAEYLRFARNLFPYKRAGFIFDEERMPLKPGKRAKTR